MSNYGNHSPGRRVKQLTAQAVQSMLNKSGNIGDHDRPLLVRNLAFYETAFVHQSYLTHGKGVSVAHNDTYEWFGDKCLGFAVSCYLNERYPDQTAGFLTDVFKQLVCGSALHRLARFHNFGDYILYGAKGPFGGTQAAPGHHHQSTAGRAFITMSIYEDTFEAFLHAIMKDNGPDDGQRYVRRFMRNNIETCIDLAQIVRTQENHKDLLQKAFQGFRWTLPKYVDIKGSPAKCVYKALYIADVQLKALSSKIQARVRRYDRTMRIHLRPYGVLPEVGQVLIGVGRGGRKTQAEQQCSQIAFQLLRETIAQ